MFKNKAKLARYTQENMKEEMLANLLNHITSSVQTSMELLFDYLTYKENKENE